MFADLMCVFGTHCVHVCECACFVSVFGMHCVCLHTSVLVHVRTCEHMCVCVVCVCVCVCVHMVSLFPTPPLPPSLLLSHNFLSLSLSLFLYLSLFLSLPLSRRMLVYIMMSCLVVGLVVDPVLFAIQDCSTDCVTCRYMFCSWVMWHDICECDMRHVTWCLWVYMSRVTRCLRVSCASCHVVSHHV